MKKKKKIKVVIQTQIHLPLLNWGFDASLNWTNMTVKSNWLFPGFYKHVASNWEWKCDFSSLSLLISHSADVLWKMLAVKVIRTCAQQLPDRQGVPSDTAQTGNFWLMGIFFSTEHDMMLTKDTAFICLRFTVYSWHHIQTIIKLCAVNVGSHLRTVNTACEKY